jgi:hypothetical protein
MDFDLSNADASFWGEDADDCSARSVASAGDVNGDGRDDFLIGAYNDEDGGAAAGQTYLILGRAAADWGMDFDLSNADASFWGEDAGDYSGWSVASAGDINGDGRDDFLIGAIYDDDGGSNAGQTYLILGRAAADWGMDFDLSNADASFWGEDEYDYSGCSVASAGDVNGDGGDDFLIGANYDEDGGSMAGQTYLILGRAAADWGMDFDLSNADASFWGQDADDRSGYSVASAGDVNGDGGDDFLIGAFYDEDGGSMAGQTYLWLGSPPQYDLTISSTSGGNVTAPGEGTFTYDEGTVVSLVAEADGCFEFVYWSGDVDTIADINNATTTIRMDDDYSVTANFDKIGYHLATDSTTGGSVTTPGEDTFPYDCGTVVDLVAEADSCYEFVYWSGDVGTIADDEDATTTIIMNGDYSITANFDKISYNLATDSTSGGSVTTPGEGISTYDEGTVIDLIAEADSCYEFVNWTGDVGTISDDEDATTTITMDGDYSITANFDKISYDLTTDSTTGGSVTTPGEGTFPYDCGTAADLVAEPEEGYQFVNWTGDVGDIEDVNSASTYITLNDNYSITANFEEIGDGQPACGMATLADLIPFGLVSVGLVAVWATKRRRSGP